MSAIRENLAKNIKHYLDIRGMSNKELANLLGVTAPSVTNWIKGKNSPDIEYIAKICEILNVSINELMGVTEKRSSIELKLIQNYNSLDYIKQIELLNYSNYLVETYINEQNKKHA